ncbi:MAG TPA: TldD/PmbA family protein [Candidatus Limnocylindrales bacterium]|nr:TldD/PmbA family protein [Candidatus Limnocylindrales bacterium]
MKDVETARLIETARIKRFCDDLLERSSADETEVLLNETDSALTRFANNGIHQNVAERNLGVRVRVVKDGRTGVASVNQMNEAALADVLERALTIAALQPPSEPVPMARPSPHRPVNAWSDSTAAASPEERADFVQAVCRKAAGAGLKAFGAVSTQAGQIAIANSFGVFRHHRATQAVASSVVMGEAGSGYADRAAIDVSELRGDDLAEEVIDKARRNQNAAPIEPGTYEVVLEEYAVGEMLEFMSYLGFSALAVQEQRSFMRLGEKLTAENVTIWDDGLDPTGMPAPFDFEGVPKQRVDLITRGVATGVVYDQATAHKEGRPSTGHGLPAPNPDGPFALNMFMAPGRVPRSELTSGIKRGIWITRFWYVRVVHPKASIITGMTRDGTFLIEDGRITRPIKDMRFTQSMLEALSGAEAIADSTKLQASGEAFGVTRVPALRVRAFTFSS